MNPIRSFESLKDHFRHSGIRRRVAVLCASDEHTLEAVGRALEAGFADLIMVGGGEAPARCPVLQRYPGRVEMISADDVDQAARIAVGIMREGKADVLMKGLINTENLLKAVLSKEGGILPKGNVLSHITVAQIPGRDRLLFVSDVAVIPEPTFEQRVAQVRYLADACRKFGIERPRIALIHCNEKINPKMPVTLEYRRIAEMAAQGEFGDALIDGPLDVRTACDAEAARIKGIDSPVAGNADALLFPGIEAANVFYKTITYWGGALTGAMLVGTSAPVVLTSRSDATEAKFTSLIAACMM